MSDLPTANRSYTPKRVAKMASNQPTNLNHLLNFTLPPRQARPLGTPRRSRKTGNTQGVWNKERELAAPLSVPYYPNHVPSE